MQLSKYSEILTIENKNYAVSLISGSTVILPNDIDELDENEKQSLLKSGILTTLDEENEIKFVNDFRSFLWENDNKHTVVTIAPTLSCNLACTYCFERDSGVYTQVESISVENMKIIINFLKKNKIYKVGLFGGEPFLRKNYQLLKPLFIFIQENNGYIYAPTNGTQIHYFKEYLAPNCISEITITIDGMKETHDNLRITKGGKGTFDVILQNIELALEKKCTVNIRMNTNNENYESCLKLKIYLNKKFNKKLVINISPIRGKLESFQYGDKKIFIHPILSKLRQFIVDKKNYIPSTHSFCATTSKKGNLIFAPNGIWNCHHTIGIEKEKVTNYLNINNYTIEKNKLPQFNEPCNSCKYILICAGGCEVNNHYQTCNVDKTHAMFKKNLEDIIKMTI